jgi:Kdo2-lipid IVA lauroyltransferase/acyltransferase
LMDHLMGGDRPLIVLSGHYGNWELAGFLFGMFGFPTVSVARTLDNPYLDR